MMEQVRKDVVVVGGGPGGFAAAVTAARAGAKVLLVERNGYLGGQLGSGLPFFGFLGFEKTSGNCRNCRRICRTAGKGKGILWA